MQLLGQLAIVVQESVETPTVDYPVIKHSTIGKQIVNYFNDSLIVEPSADAPIVGDSTICQQVANYSSNSLAVVPSTETLEVESLATE